MTIKLNHSRNSSVMRLSLRETSGLLACVTFLLAPFTWSYVASAGGMLIRAVDLALLMSLLVMVLRFRMAVLPFLVPACLSGLIALSLLRAIVHNDASSIISAAKICYYLMSTLALATAIREMDERQNDRMMIYAIILISPVLGLFIINLGSVFIDLVQARSIGTMSRIIFNGWNQIFSENIFSSSDALEARGVEFRNSAGIAFVVSALFFYLWDGKVNRIFAVILMVISAALFSRSVWLVQLLFIFLLVFRSNVSGRFIILSFVLLCAIAISVSPTLIEAISDRFSSTIGRSEMLSVGFDYFNHSVFLGGPEGANVLISDGEERPVHNVPLAFGLKAGFLGFLLSILIQLNFFLIAASRFFILVCRRSVGHRSTLVVIVLSVILFVRPLVSASHDIYFSIGEWCALAMLLALQRETGAHVVRRGGSGNLNSRDRWIFRATAA